MRRAWCGRGPAQPALRVLVALLVMLNLMLLPPASALGAEIPTGDHAWRLTADSVRANRAAGLVAASGNVSLSDGTDYITATNARYWLDSGWVYLEGNVRARFGKYELYAQEAEFNLKTQTGWLKEGLLFSADPHIFVEAERINKLSTDVYDFNQATVTACDADTPAWSIEVDSGRVQLEGFAELWGTTFKTYDVPFLYSPWAAVPISTNRETGLLFPGVGTGSRLGFFYQQPLYIVLDEERDMTIWGDYYTKRGPMLGTEYRNFTDSQTKGIWRADYVYDTEVANSVSDEDAQFQDQGLVRPNHNRYWLRSKYNGWFLDPSLEAKLDLDYVSDSTYTRTFDVGHANYDQSEQLFIDEFGRGLDVIDATERTSAGLLTKRYAGLYALNAKATYTQNLKYMNDNRPGDMNPTVQKLPELTAYAYKQSIQGTPLEWRGVGELSYNYRNYGTTGVRLDVFPQLSMPLTSSYGSLIPTVGWRQTVYGIDKFENATDLSHNNVQFRGVPELRVDGFSEVFRVFDTGDEPAVVQGNVGESSWVKVKHSLQPRFEYVYIPDVDQDQHPEWDDLDRLAPASEITYSLTNVLDRKRARITRQMEDGQPLPALDFDYREFLRFRLEQTFDFREATRNQELDRYPRRPFSDIQGELIIRPESWVNLTSRTFLSPYTGHITRHEHKLNLEADGIGSVYFGLDFLSEIDEYTRTQENAVNMWRFGGELQLPYDLIFKADLQQDLEKGENVYTDLALTYRHQCFDLTLAYSDTQYDERIAIWVTVLGFESPSLEF